MNKIKVYSAEQVAMLLEVLGEEHTEDGKCCLPFKYALDYEDKLNELRTRPQSIKMIVKEDDITITGKTYPLHHYLDQIGFTKDPEGSNEYHPTDLLSDFPALAQEVVDLCDSFGWNTVEA